MEELTMLRTEYTDADLIKLRIPPARPATLMRMRTRRWVELVDRAIRAAQVRIHDHGRCFDDTRSFISFIRHPP